ncbi:Curli production assembly/transport component CsgG [Winogradskyella ursingii]|uniref:Curli production assembly/transport component CsgG n=1 Tax=Winogradskyella ursingii TaxID=2686079 RepID=UPI0015C9EE9E|nr:Curli production assembly/transport component CsgG [Winogradskyella ursingii]
MFTTIYAQEQTEQKSAEDFEKLSFFDYRGTNALDVAIGTATIIGGDVPSPDYGTFFRIGYKRSIVENLSIGLLFNKYTLPFNNIEIDLVSIDLGLEFMVLPFDDFSPFVYGGFGYNATDDWEANTVKVQGGIGFEYIITNGIGLKLFAEYNNSFEDQEQFLIFDDNDDSFLRLGLGVNIYFGGEKEREERLKNIPTYIKSKPILFDN